jgi:uncharacterized protein (DUF1501 family)
MKRRTFLQAAGSIGAAPLMLGGFKVQALAAHPLFTQLAAANCDNNVFVLIQLSGGNDGLNMIIPRDRYPEIMAARSNIAIPEASVLPLTTETGINPVMTGMQQLFQNGKLAVVQSVGYPEPNFSHFRSTDIWLTAADYYQTIPTGWLGRYLADQFPAYPTGASRIRRCRIR